MATHVIIVNLEWLACVTCRAGPGLERPQPQTGKQISVSQGIYMKNICSMLHVVSTSYNTLIEVNCRESAADTDFLL